MLGSGEGQGCVSAMPCTLLGMTFLFFTITRTLYYIIYIYILYTLTFFFFNLNLLSVLLNVSRVCAVGGGAAQTCPLLESPFLSQGDGMLVWD